MKDFWRSITSEIEWLWITLFLLLPVIVTILLYTFKITGILLSSTVGILVFIGFPFFIDFIVGPYVYYKKEKSIFIRKYKEIQKILTQFLNVYNVREFEETKIFPKEIKNLFKLVVKVQNFESFKDEEKVNIFQEISEIKIQEIIDKYITILNISSKENILEKKVLLEKLKILEDNKKKKQKYTSQISFLEDLLKVENTPEFKKLEKLSKIYEELESLNNN